MYVSPEQSTCSLWWAACALATVSCSYEMRVSDDAAVSVDAQRGGLDGKGPSSPPSVSRIQSGEFKHLGKPFTRIALLAAVRGAIDRS